MVQKPQFAAHTPPENQPHRWHSLKQHLSKVAAKSRQLAEKFGAGEIGHYAGLWHDLGKYNPNFQTYLVQCEALSRSGASEFRDRVPHAIYGAKLAAEKLEPLALLIAGHHTGLQTYRKLGNDLENRVDSAVYRAILSYAASEALDLEISTFAQQQLRGLFQDWHSYELLLRLLFSCLVDADYLDTEAHFDPAIARSAVQKLP